jgi:glyoxylase-like metal-dependent hydrolase (beta-lactamase superfamily II)
MSMDGRPPREAGRLEYPFDDPPAPGCVRKLTEGVFWLRIPMPGRLDHINAWLLEDGDGFTLVDTGMNVESAREAWQTAFAEVLKGRPVTRVIVTHLHPDHVGLAGWLCEMFGCELWMSRTEYMMCRALVSDTGRPAPKEAIRFYHAAGLGDESLEAYRESFGRFGRMIHELPNAYRRLQEGQRLNTGAREWQVLIGRGHAPEHVCLYCPALNVFISGDQILPRISSNVSVFPQEPEGNPLGEWLDSCARFKDLLPADVLVLPAHHDAFIGARTRLAALIAEHEEKMGKLLVECVTPRRAADLFSLLFRSKINADNAIAASGEAVAHLNCLIHRGQMMRNLDSEGVCWYQTRA